MAKYYNNSPVNDYASYGPYSQILGNKIDDPNVFNIGIIASYGAGKSSLIKTYENSKEGKKKKILKISLASFNDSNDSLKKDDQIVENAKFGDSEEKLNDLNPSIKKERNIELSILQQILYSKKACSFPKTRLSRIGNESTTRKVIGGILYFILLHLFLLRYIF